MQTKNKALLIGLSGFLLLLFGWLRTGKLSPNHPAKDLFQKANQLNLTPEQSKWLVYQSAHETNFWTSKVFIDNNNFFGMKPARVRPRMQAGEKNGYALYLDSYDSLYDLLLWFEYNKIDLTQIDNMAEYVGMLKYKGYFEDSQENYYNGMLNAKNKLKL